MTTSDYPVGIVKLF